MLLYKANTIGELEGKQTGKRKAVKIFIEFLFHNKFYTYMYTIMQ